MVGISTISWERAVDNFGDNFLRFVLVLRIIVDNIVDKPLDNVRIRLG